MRLFPSKRQMAKLAEWLQRVTPPEVAQTRHLEVSTHLGAGQGGAQQPGSSVILLSAEILWRPHARFSLFI